MAVVPLVGWRGVTQSDGDGMACAVEQKQLMTNLKLDIHTAIFPVIQTL